MGSHQRRAGAQKAVFPASFVPRFRQGQRGIALISVLAMVVLLTVLVVAFMMRAGTEKQASGFSRAEATTRELSDTTLNLVEGLINEGTSQGITYAWASQPGAIRVFDNNTGAPYKTFKLYSAASTSSSTPSMVSSDITLAKVQTFLAPDPSQANWFATPGSWVDLNAPVNTDPAPKSVTISGKTLSLGSPIYTHFPVLDPRDPTADPAASTYDNVTAKMDGFSITGAPTDNPISDPNAAIDSTQSANPAPMPVQWLYVLQNGTLTAPNPAPDSSGNYTFPNTAPATSNPIVGRIAFWTDDETCKVNINTAAGDGSITAGDPTNVACGPLDTTPGTAGMFWDTPYFSSVDDINLADYQPFQGEFQRYPGHPGTVSYNNILNSLGYPVVSANFYNVFSGGTMTTQGLTPRYTYNPSINLSTSEFTGASVTFSSSILPLSYSRLYPTVAEMLFNTDRTASWVNKTNEQSRQEDETARFFLTAHSRAPELNLYGLPRVCI